MLKLFVTRHGETVWNTEKRLQGWKDSDLTKKGEVNAESLGCRLKDIEFTSIYSSPSIRTVKTTEIIKGEREQEVFTNENLREIHLGEWEGQTYDVLEEQHPTEFQAFWNTPHLYTSDSGESFYQLQERVQRFLNRIQTEHTSGNILVVTHSVFIKALLTLLRNKPIEQLWDPPFIHDTSLTVIEMQDRAWEVKIEGDISHRDEQNARVAESAGK
ncbi:histidine phosphatase family protein [Falsibacillus pallidus]|uniref:Putative phosphoglycerate mutase n=1 Tax=Falsibacillus pallidus TaxID=493781 RepID=A0A370G0J6_9BACI|nr:histidine phosphatase family protein [Falsibacillus pallidus]RDI37262.1 putative phosphoglycerate mutase [Falsibacillus pallidus]